MTFACSAFILKLPTLMHDGKQWCVLEPSVNSWTGQHNKSQEAALAFVSGVRLLKTLGRSGLGVFGGDFAEHRLSDTVVIDCFVFISCVCVCVCATCQYID